MTDTLRITHIERQPRRKRLAVHTSDGASLTVTPDIAARFHLTQGQDVTHERLQMISAAQAREDAMAAALRLVAFRPRSEKEMRQALARRAVDPTLRDETVSRLRELGLLDDRSFAQSFVDSRDRSSPRSRRLLAQELRLKGVAREVASESAAAVDDADAAYRAAARRARSMTGVAYPDFERRLGAFLLRRGFNYQAARDTVRRLWREQDTGDGLPGGPD
jgi:regulatory protein